MSLVLELISVTIITILLIAALVWAGPAAWDPAQVFAQGAPFQGIAAGMVLGILGSGMVFAWTPYSDKQLARFAARDAAKAARAQQKQDRRAGSVAA